MQAWVHEELQGVELGDARLEQRYRLLLDRLSQRPSLSIPNACEGWAETMAAYRWFAHRRVTVPAVLAPHQQATQQRLQQYPVVLLVQDTTELEVTRREEVMGGAGPLNDASRRGFYCHAQLALTPERLPLGLVAAEIWARDAAAFPANPQETQARKRQKKALPIEAKESFRWLQGYRSACAVARQAPQSACIALSDSEGDIYDCFAAAVAEEVPGNLQWIVRACQDRCLLSAGGGEGKASTLWARVASTPVLGTLQIDVSKNLPNSSDPQKRQQARSARRTEASVQATSLVLQRPQGKRHTVPAVPVQAILVHELQPPGQEEPLDWLLLTSLPLDSFAAICQVIDYYCCRWQIEIYFRVLKSGCRVEARQFETAERYLPCLAVYLVISWRVLYVLMLGRTCPELPCDLVFSEAEWKAVYLVVRRQEPPPTAPPLGELVALIGRLGGHLGRRRDGPPGPKAMWIGLQRTMDFALAYRTFRPSPPGRPRRV